MFRRLILLLVIPALAAMAWYAFAQYQRWHEAPLPVAPAGETLLVPSGEPLNRLAKRLEEAATIEHAWDLKLLARLRGVEGQLKAGEYELEPGITLAGLLDKLVAGRVKLYALTVVEGTSARQLLDQLAAHPGIKQTLETQDLEALAELLNLPVPHAEGWFLPETYHFPLGTSDLEFLQRAHRAMRQVLDAAWEQRANDLPIDSKYEALILASIVEKETAVESERGRIAGVFSRRLERGMRLQTDPTVIYGMGEDYAGNITRRDLDTVTPYNTYRVSGLPPTPIALPSRESLFAAVNPEAGNALYFVARGAGCEHVFSATLEEHNRAVREYQQRGVANCYTRRAE